MSAAPRPGPRGRPGSRSRSRRWLVAVPPLLVLLEVLGLLLVGQAIGAGWTVLLVLAGVVVGGVVLVRGGLGGVRRAAEGARRRAATASTPADLEGARTGRELADAGLVALGALLLVVPGFLTDVVGILALLPFTRPLLRRLIGAAAGAAALRVVGSRRGDVVAGGVVVDTGGERDRRGGAEPLEGRVLPPPDEDGPGSSTVTP